MEQNKDQIGAAVRGEAVAEIEPADLMARFEKWKAYPLPALNSDGHFDKDWLHREFVAFKAGIVSAGAADAPSEPGERGYPVYLAWNDQINAWVDVGLAEYLAADVQDRRVAYEPQGAAA